MIHPDTVYSFVPVTKLVPSIRQSELSLNPSGRTGVLLQFTKPLTPGTIDTTIAPTSFMWSGSMSSGSEMTYKYFDIPQTRSELNTHLVNHPITEVAREQVLKNIRELRNKKELTDE